VKYTSAPWIISSPEGKDALQFPITGRFGTKVIAWIVRDRDAEATANLIVAAPEMFEVLQWTLENYENRLTMGHVDMIRRALNKARGGE